MNMKKGEVITVPAPDRQTVLRLAEIGDMGSDPDNAPRDKVAAQLDRQLSDELSDEYLKYLHVLFPVVIDQDILDNMKQQGQQGG
jgi:hypothetical protein